MKQSVILALSATLLTAMGIAKPHNHQHLHKRDMVTVTVTEDVLEIVNVVVTVYNDGAATRTALSTTRTTRHGASSSKAAEPSSSSPLAALKLPSTSPSSEPPSNTGENSPAKDNTPARGDESAHDGLPAAGGSSPFKQQAENIRKQEENIKAQNKINDQQEKANEEQAKKNGSPQEKAAAPAVPEQKAATPQEESKQVTSGSIDNTHSDESHSASKSEESNNGGGGPSGGACGQVGGKCTGEITMYNDVGMGACGWTMDPATQDYFALGRLAMGEYSNNAGGEEEYVEANQPQPNSKKNAFCGRKATISANGKQFSAVLTDKCGGCQGAWDVDVSSHLWNKLYPGNEMGSRHSNIEWWFTGPELYHGP